MKEEFFEQQKNIKIFEKIVAGEESTIHIAEAALCIAAIEYPLQDFSSSISLLDTFASRARDLLPQPMQAELTQSPLEVPLRIIDAINQVLFEQEKFHGNKSNYYTPDNSFLNRVLEPRDGIPISLSLV